MEAPKAAFRVDISIGFFAVVKFLPDRGRERERERERERKGGVRMDICHGLFLSPFFHYLETRQ